MIDFRYHLVSLVSVFLALAVGIVLGAGPLKDPIGNSLTDSVNSLRQEKDTLHDRLDTANTSLQQRDDFITHETQTLVSNQLVGRSVVLISLPGVNNDDVSPLVSAIKEAGGSVTGQVTLGNAWTDPSQATTRDKAVSDLAIDLPPGTSATSNDSSLPLAELLAAALVSPESDRASDTSAFVLKRFRSDSLIGIKGDVDSTLADAALVLAPPNEEVDQNIKPTAASTDVNASYVTLTTALDTVGGGVVVTGPPSAAIGDGVLAAVRKDDPAKSEVSTVDTGETPAGVILAILALREQLDHGSGAYGYVGSGTKPLPQLPAITATPSPTPSVSATKK